MLVAEGVKRRYEMAAQEMEEEKVARNNSLDDEMSPLIKSNAVVDSFRKRFADPTTTNSTSVQKAIQDLKRLKHEQ